MNTIADYWEQYRATVMPPNGHPDISEAAGIAIIEGWQDECTHFRQQVAAGQA